MVAIVKLNETLEHTLNRISKKLHKEKSDIIKDAIIFYANSIENTKKSKLAQVAEKTKEIDKKEFYDFLGTQNDGM